MHVRNKQLTGLAVLAAGAMLAFNANATTIPSGWVCSGNCGTSGADGVVVAPPNGHTTYQWISTADGKDAVGTLPSGALGDEKTGSTLATSVFSATAGTKLDFYFNFVTADGADSGTTYADYAWAALFDSTDHLAALLFTARTEQTGSIVPGSGMPGVNAVLSPASVPIIAGAPDWTPLGTDDGSGSCYGPGCGYTGWINADYTIATAGDYYLKVGVVNWLDTDYQTGLAMSGVTVDGKPINTPEPAALGMFGLGVLLIGLFAGLRRHAA